MGIQAKSCAGDREPAPSHSSREVQSPPEHPKFNAAGCSPASAATVQPKVRVPTSLPVPRYSSLTTGPLKINARVTAK